MVPLLSVNVVCGSHALEQSNNNKKKHEMKMIWGNKNIKIKIRSSPLNSNLSDSKLTEEKNDERKRANIGIRTHDHCAEDTYNGSR